MGPVETAKGRWADVHGGSTRHWPHAGVLDQLPGPQVDVFPDLDEAGKALGRQELTVAAVESEVEAGLVRLKGDRELPPTLLHGEEEVLMRRIQVPRIIRKVLVVPPYTAAVDVEGEDRVGIQVRTLAQIGV